MTARDRLAAVQHSHRPAKMKHSTVVHCVCGWQEPAQPSSDRHYANHVADAMIAAGATLSAAEPPQHVNVKRIEGRKIRLDRWCRPCGVWCGLDGNCPCCREANR